MSYILDALRKSDEERLKHQDQQQRSYSPYAGAGRDTRKKRVTAGLIISAALLLSIALLGGGWWLSSQQLTVTPDGVLSPDLNTSSDIQPSSGDTPSAPAAALEPSRPAISQPPSASPASDPTSAVSPESAHPAVAPPASSPRQQSTAETAQEPLTDQVVPRGDLPFALQAALPEMKFSGHAYSTAPELRLIMINQAVVREGELIAPDLRLEEITENGLIMNYRGTRFSIELF